MTFDTLIFLDTSTNVNMRMQCCEPLFDGVLEEEGAARTAALFAALADPVRLRIVSMLAAAPGGTACGCELEDPLGLAQPTVSHHLRILREAGLVAGERRGKVGPLPGGPRAPVGDQGCPEPVRPRAGVDHSSSISCRRVTVFQLRAVPVTPRIFSK